MSANPTRRDRVIDGVLVGLALLFAASQVIGRQALDDDQGPRQFGPSDVREIEELGLVHDASAQYPTAIRDLIGLEGNPDDGPAQVVAEALELVRPTPWATSLRFTAAALATALDQDAAAIAELRALEARADPTLEPEWVLPVTALRAQASGEAVALEPIIAKLREIGATGWIVARVEARHLRNAGATAEAAAAREAAVTTAVGYVDTTMTVQLTQWGLLLLGLAFVLAAPFARRALAIRGFAGLAGTVSSFALDRTQRVILGWFVGHSLIAFALGSVALAVAADTRARMILDTVQVLAHGLLAVALIQALARRPGDARPLGRALDLHTDALPRRALGLAAWLLPGVGFITFLAAAGTVFSFFIIGPPDRMQPTIELLIRDDSAATLAFAVLAAVILAPLIEELLFRGFLYRNLRDLFGVWGAVVLAGLIFGAVHLDPQRMLPLSAIGIGLALLYEWSGSLLTPILVHATWNLLNLLGVWVIYQAA